MGTLELRSPAGRALLRRRKPEPGPVFSLKNKITLVTGAASGIGASIAELFAQAGAHVYVADVDPKGAQETVIRIRQARGSAELVDPVAAHPNRLGDRYTAVYVCKAVSLRRSNADGETPIAMRKAAENALALR